MANEPDPNFARSVDNLGRIIYFLYLVAPGRALAQPSSLWREAAGPSKLGRVQFAVCCVGYWCVRNLVRPWSSDGAERRRLRRFLWLKLRNAFLAWTRADAAGTPRTAAAAVDLVVAVVRETRKAYAEGTVKRARQWVEDPQIAHRICRSAAHEAQKCGAGASRSDDVAHDAFVRFLEYDELVERPDAFIRMTARRLCMGKPTRRIEELDPESVGVAPTVEAHMDWAALRREFEIFKPLYRDQRGMRMIEWDFFAEYGPEMAQQMEFATSYAEDHDELVEKIHHEVEAARADPTGEPTPRARRVLEVLGPGVPLEGPAYDRAIEDAAAESYKVSLRTAKLRAFNALREHLVMNGYRAPGGR